MGQKVASLEIELLMATGQAVSDLIRFGGVVDKQSADAIKALDRIDAAMQGIGDLSDAERSMVKFAETTAKSAVDAAREFARIERAGESMSAQLDRQISVFGKTSDEIRAMKVETTALAAEQAGQIELAERIRAQQEQLIALEEAAIAKKERETEAVREAANAYQMFEARARSAMQVYRDEQSGNAARDREQEAIALRDASIAYQMFETRVRAGAAAMRETELAAERDAAAVKALRAMLDPATASQERLAAAIEDSRRIMTAAGFSAAEMAKVEQLLTKTGGELTNSHNRMGSAGMEMMHVSRALSDSIAAGISPVQALTMEFGRITEATSLWAAQTGKTEGAVGQLASFMGGPWGIFLTLGTVALAPLVEKMFEGEKASDKFAEALKHEKTAIEALDEATGRLHRTKQQEIDQSARATQQFLKEALARRQILASNLQGEEAASNTAGGGTIAGTAQAGASIMASATASRLAANAAEIKRLQDALGGVGFTAAVDRAKGAVDKSFKATQDYEAELVRIQAAWDRSGKTAHDQALVQELVTRAIQKRDAVTKESSGSQLAAADAQAREATAATAVAKAQADLILVKQHAAAQLKDGTVTQAQATAEIEVARRALVAAQAEEKNASAARVQHRKDERQAVHDATVAEREREAALKDSYKDELALQKVLATQFKLQPVDVKGLLDVVDVNKVLKEEAEAAQQQWKKLDEQVTTTAAHMRDAFGSVGGAIGEAMSAIVKYGAEQDRIAKETLKAGDDQKRVDDLKKQSVDNQLNGLIGLTSAAKGLFSEHSKGYEAMMAAEKALTIIQLARTAVDVAGGAARMFASLGPFAFPAVAAMLGVMASLGFSGGGSSTSAADYSKGNTGTGTVLGAPTAQSASIKNAIDALKDIDDKTLSVSRDMLASLKVIQNNIGGVAALVARTDTAGSLAAGVNTGSSIDLSKIASTALSSGGGALAGFVLGGPVGAVLGTLLGGVFGGLINGLFGSTKKVIGDGLTALPKQLGDIVTSGYDLLSYADIQKKSKFFGITTGTSYSTQIGAGDPGVAANFTKIFQGIYQSIELAAKPLGLATDEITSKLDHFVIDLGKINLKDLSGEDIQKQLEAVFSAASDTIAEAVIPGLEKFQKVGEGYFDTLVRVATTVEQVDATFGRLGVSSKSMGVEVDMAIANMFDSVNDFTSLAGSYFQEYYSKGEQAAAISKQIGDALGGMGLAMPDTLAGFRSLVEAQDLTTEAGQKTYVTLLQLAPAFSDLKTSLEGAKSAADILSEQQDLQNQLLQLTGNTAAIRAAQIASLDPSNRALQEQIYAIQDAQDAAKAASDLADAWKSVGDSIMDEIKRIRGLGDSASSGSFASLLGQFNAESALARAGDQDAAKSLPELSKSLLDAAALAATSRQELDRIQAQTATSLQMTYDVISELAGTAGTSSGASASALASAASASASSSSSGGDTAAAIAELRQELADTRSDLRNALATIANNTGGIKKTLDNVTGPSGGQAVSVAVAA